MTTTVFLGPSLPLDRAREILPDGDFRPPARQGDIYSVVVNERPDAIGIIDGVFLDVLSTWHKEILFALSEGIAVYGAASMGALRAAECARYGMIGVGRIYQWYASGELERDDEVAVSHSTAEFGYRPLSEPLVTIRATLAAAEQRGLLTTGESAAMIDAAAALHFPQRSWQSVLAASGVAPATATRIQHFVRTSRVDQKALDARELLTVLANRGDAPVTPPPEWDFEHTHYLSALAQRDRWVVRDGTAISFDTIARYVSANDPRAGERADRGLLRLVTNWAAAQFGIAPTERECTAEQVRICDRLGLHTAEDLDTYRAANDLSEDEFAEIVRTDATERKLLDWLRACRYKLGSTAPLLGEYRRSGEYPQWADDAVLAQQLTGTGSDGLPLPVALPIDSVDRQLRRHRAATGWCSDTAVHKWAKAHDFGHLEPLLMEMEKGRRVRRLRNAAAAAARNVDGFPLPSTAAAGAMDHGAPC